MFDSFSFLEGLYSIWRRLTSAGIVSGSDVKKFAEVGSYFYNAHKAPSYEEAVDLLVNSYNNPL